MHTEIDSLTVFYSILVATVKMMLLVFSGLFLAKRTVLYFKAFVLILDNYNKYKKNNHQACGTIPTALCLICQFHPISKCC